jgi:outer membrane protein assembly factor BamA
MMNRSLRYSTNTAAVRAFFGALAAAVVLSSMMPARASAAVGDDRVIVIGNRAFKSGEVLALAHDGGWRPDTGTNGLAALQEAYFREGYLRARFEVDPATPGSQDSTVAIVIDEGEVARVGRVHVRGVRVRSAEAVRAALGLEESAEFVPRVFERRVDDLLRSYDEDGLPFVQLWVDSLELDAPRNVVHVSVHVVEGRERTLENIDVDGAAKTKPELIARMSGLEPGTTYRGEMLRDAYLRLEASGVFNGVEYPRLRVSPDGRGVDAVLVVDETTRSNSFTGVMGYAAAEEGGEDQLSGLVQLRLNNIGGTLKDFHAFWTNDGKGRSETRLQYRDRFFLGRLFTAGLSLEQVGQDTLYTWQSAGIEAGRPSGRFGRNLVSFLLSLHADRNVFSEGPLLRSWRYRAGLALSLVRGDPRKRTFADATTRFTLARKTSYYRDTDDTESLNQYILEFEGDGSVGLLRSLSLYLGLVYRGLESDEETVPLSEQFYIGGARTLRGYRENQFHGPRVATTRTELRVGSTADENLFLFVDTGYVEQRLEVPEGVVGTDIFKVGYGFGLRTRSQVGVIGLSFGLGEEVSLGQAKVHILLEQNF